MYKIISLFINLLNCLSKFLFNFSATLTLFLQNYEDKKAFSKDMHLYRKFDVDPLPVSKLEHQSISIDEAVRLYELKHHKPLKPIKRRNNSIPIDPNLYCPYCSASHDYIYDNTGKSLDFLCKVCENTFSINKDYIEQLSHFCPFCGYKLSIAKDRTHFNVFKCPNNNCSFYRKSLKQLTKSQKKEYKTNPSAFKLRYITRIFNASLTDLEKLQSKITPSKVSLTRIRNSKHALGLILSYYINYSLSLRKTALILKELHNINVSYQTVANYAQAASNLVDDWIKDYQYDDLSSLHCGDETYIKVKGKNAYVFFMCDSVKKIITSWNVFEKRDSFSAIQTFYSVIRKFKVIPQDLKIVVDGNPIYKVAQQFFQQRDIFIDVIPVIGLTNVDETSKKYRPQKQIIERLNRTFKYSYYVKNGFSTIDHSNNFMALFTTYFNFLRNHTSLGYKPPVELELLKDITNMPTKWNIILDLAEKHLTQKHLLK